MDFQGYDSSSGTHCPEEGCYPLDDFALVESFESQTKLLSGNNSFTGARFRAPTPDTYRTVPWDPYRVADAHRAIESLLSERKMFTKQVSDLQCALETARSQVVATQQLATQAVAEERHYSRVLAAERDEAIFECNAACCRHAEAAAELGEAFADVEALQASLHDASEYIKLLKEEVLALHLEGSRLVAADKAKLIDAKAEVATGKWEKTKDSIRQAVRDAYKLSEGERNKKIKQLQLRWHPDKNPIIKDFAEEVIKLINATSAEMSDAAATQEQRQQEEAQKQSSIATTNSTTSSGDSQGCTSFPGPVVQAMDQPQPMQQQQSALNFSFPDCVADLMPSNAASMIAGRDMSYPQWMPAASIGIRLHTNPPLGSHVMPGDVHVNRGPMGHPTSVPLAGARAWTGGPLGGLASSGPITYTKVLGNGFQPVRPQAPLKGAVAGSVGMVGNQPWPLAREAGGERAPPVYFSRG